MTVFVVVVKCGPESHPHLEGRGVQWDIQMLAPLSAGVPHGDEGVFGNQGRLGGRQRGSRWDETCDHAGQKVQEHCDARD